VYFVIQCLSLTQLYLYTSLAKTHNYLHHQKNRYIGDINRAAHVEENAPYFKPHTNDANELHTWGLGTTQSYAKQQQQKQQQKPQTWPATQQQRPPTLQHQQHQQHQQQHQHHQQHPLQNQQHQFGFQKPHGSSHSLNKLQSLDEQRYHNSPVPKFKLHNNHTHIYNS